MPRAFHHKPTNAQRFLGTQLRFCAKHVRSSSTQLRSKTKVKEAMWTDISSNSLSTVSSTDNSLSRVLFIFRSSYLFASGVHSIFSFTRHTAGGSSISPKILYSLQLTVYTQNGNLITGLSPSLADLSRTFTRSFQARQSRIYHNSVQWTIDRFQHELFSVSFATTTEIAVAFFSLAYWYA